MSLCGEVAKLVSHMEVRILLRNIIHNRDDRKDLTDDCQV